MYDKKIIVNYCIFNADVREEIYKYDPSLKSTVEDGEKVKDQIKTRATKREFKKELYKLQAEYIKKGGKIPGVVLSKKPWELPKADRPIEWIIEGFAHKYDFNQIYSQAKVGKTQFAIELAYSIYKGIPLLGMKTNQTNVLYFDFELHDNEIKSRTNSIIRHLGYDPEDGCYEVVAFRDLQAEMDDPTPNDIVDILNINLALHEDVGVLILDNLNAMFPESDMADGKETKQAIKTIRRGIPDHITTFFVNHTAKPTKDTQLHDKPTVTQILYGYMGSSAIANEVDQTIYIYRDRDDDDKKKYATICTTGRGIDGVKYVNCEYSEETSYCYDLIDEEEEKLKAFESIGIKSDTGRLTGPEDLDLNGKRKDNIMRKFPGITDWDSWAEENGYHFEKLDGKNKFFVKD